MATAREKVEAILAAYNVTAREFDIPGTDLSVSLQKAPELVGDDLVVWFNVSRAGVPVPVNNPFVFRNPPLRRGTDDQDRPLLAFVQMCIDAIKQAAA